MYPDIWVIRKPGDEGGVRALLPYHIQWRRRRVHNAKTERSRNGAGQGTEVALIIRFKLTTWCWRSSRIQILEYQEFRQQCWPFRSSVRVYGINDRARRCAEHALNALVAYNNNATAPFVQTTSITPLCTSVRRRRGSAVSDKTVAGFYALR